MEFDPVERIQSTPRFQHSRLGRALRSGNISSVPESPLRAQTPEQVKFFEEMAAEGIVMATTGEVLDFTDSAEAARIASESDPDAELHDLEEENETAPVAAHALASDTTIVPKSLYLESGYFNTDDVLSIDPEESDDNDMQPVVVDDSEDHDDPIISLVTSVPVETEIKPANDVDDTVIEVEKPESPDTDDHAFAQGAQMLFDDIAAAQVQKDLEADLNALDSKPLEQVLGIEDEPIMEVTIERPTRRALKGVKNWFKERLGREVPHRRRNIGISAGVAVATVAVAVIGVGSLRSDSESVRTTAAAETSQNPDIGTTLATTIPTIQASEARGYTTDSVTMTDQARTTTTTTEAQTPATLPDAQVTAPGVPGGISMTAEQYAAMGTVQFASMSATMTSVWENPNLTQEQRNDIVNFSWSLEQNQFAK